MEPVDFNLRPESHPIPGPINAVTDDLLKLFFKFVNEDGVSDRKSAERATLVSKNWSERMIEVQKNFFGTQLNNILKKCIKSLDPVKQANLRDELSSLLSTDIFNSTNLMDIKSSCLTMRCKIANFLSQLDNDELFTLLETVCSGEDELFYLSSKDFFSLVNKYKLFQNELPYLPLPSEMHISCEEFCMFLTLEPESTMNNVQKFVTLKIALAAEPIFQNEMIILHAMQYLKGHLQPDDFTHEIYECGKRLMDRESIAAAEPKKHIELAKLLRNEDEESKFLFEQVKAYNQILQQVEPLFDDYVSPLKIISEAIFQEPYKTEAASLVSELTSKAVTPESYWKAVNSEDRFAYEEKEDFNPENTKCHDSSDMDSTGYYSYSSDTD